MPYATIADLPANIQKLPEQKQKQFLAVFNSAYKKCEGETDCESSAFAQAHSVIGKAILEEYSELKAGARNSGSDLKQLQRMHDFAAQMHDAVVGLGATCTCDMPDETETPEEAASETPADEVAEGDTPEKPKPAKATEGSDTQGGYLVSDDTGNHLPTRRAGKLDARLLGAAHAALTVGYRGNKYQGSGKEQALAKLKKLYAEADLDWPEGKVAESNQLKAISQTDNEYRVANYLVIFSPDGKTRDLEGYGSHRINGDGSKGEYFTKATDLESTYTQTGLLYVDWEHGREDLNQDDILGYVDWKTKAVDERGVWVERVLNRRNKYVEWLKNLIDAGLVGTSSEPVQPRIAKAIDGHITRWPLKRDTLTVSPMEPRMLSENTLAALKALAGEVPCVKNACVKAGIWESCKTAELEIKAKLAYLKSVLED